MGLLFDHNLSPVEDAGFAKEEVDSIRIWP